MTCRNPPSTQPLPFPRMLPLKNENLGPNWRTCAHSWNAYQKIKSDSELSYKQSPRLLYQLKGKHKLKDKLSLTLTLCNLIKSCFFIFHVVFHVLLVHLYVFELKHQTSFWTSEYFCVHRKKKATLQTFSFVSLCKAENMCHLKEVSYTHTCMQTNKNMSTVIMTNIMYPLSGKIVNQCFSKKVISQRLFILVPANVCFLF